MDFVLGGLRFPLTPSELTISVGAVIKTWQIIQLGAVSFPRGRVARKYQFTALLVGADRAKQSFVKNWLDPQIFRSQLDHWCENGQAVSFVVTQTSINQQVYVQSVSAKVSGGFGDLECQIALLEARPLSLATQDQSNAATASPPVARPTRTIPAQYTVKEGDTLWGIAQQLYGDATQWGQIYNANQLAIGPDPLAALVPGLSLTIPGGS